MASELLGYVLDAHGELNRWNELSGLSGDVSVGGLLWQQKGRPGVLEHTNISASLRRQPLQMISGAETTFGLTCNQTIHATYEIASPRYLAGNQIMLVSRPENNPRPS
jgi:hypothetical protein